MKERILIIEDDDQILKILRRSLVYEGYQVDTAVDGEEGLNCCGTINLPWSSWIGCSRGWMDWKYAGACANLGNQPVLDADCKRHTGRPRAGVGCRCG